MDLWAFRGKGIPHGHGGTASTGRSFGPRRRMPARSAHRRACSNSNGRSVGVVVVGDAVPINSCLGNPPEPRVRNCSHCRGNERTNPTLLLIGSAALLTGDGG